jgi:CHRD domain
MTLRCLRERLFKATRYSFNPARTVLVTMVVIVLIVGTAAAQTVTDSFQTGQQEVTARLSGFNEVLFDAGPPATLRGAVSTPASGNFRAIIDENARTIDYELSYERLRATVTQAHIHFGQRHTFGGIVVWLCQTTANPAPAAVASSTPVCPQEGTVSGTITPAQVLAQNAQGFAAGDFDELVRAIRNRAAYANVHSSLFPPGEIRGHIRVSPRLR